ncbi:hypothetical protein C5613_39175 [Rhodococcus opacus]|uniref:Uncharacterized protein n=1 Tax=Rhodococcus opacus TaxID=37919 RepID=A0A2S8IK61_RHOOP|nr:hypothetical protein C5613_39175 [Rhodococcus opacus]
MCTSLFAWWLSYPVRFAMGYVGEPSGAGRMESVDPSRSWLAGLSVDDPAATAVYTGRRAPSWAVSSR